MNHPRLYDFPHESLYFFWLRDAQKVSEEGESLAERNGARVVERSEMNPRDLRGKYQ